jgi:hypothetical protein
MLPHTVSGFKVLATFITMNISIFQVISFNMPPHVGLPFHNPTSHTSPQATTLVHHLRVSQSIQVAYHNKCVVFVKRNESNAKKFKVFIHSIYMLNQNSTSSTHEHFPLWL